MAKSHHNGDSPFPSLISERPGMPGSPTILVKPAPFSAVPASKAPPVPTTYILNDGVGLYIGESDGRRRLRDHGAAVLASRLDLVSPSTTD